MAMAMAMDKDMDLTLFDYIRDKDFNTILHSILHIGPSTKTRTTKLKITSGCKWWLQIYIILYHYMLINKCTLMDINKNLHFTRTVDSIMSYSDSDGDSKHYKNIFHKNEFIEDKLSKFTPTDILYSGRDKDYYHIPLCIHNDIGIFHFFLLINKRRHDGHQEYFINSSYGSDNVCIPQYTTRVDIRKFLYFIEHINEKDNPRISTFITTYFLSGGLKIEEDPDAADLDPKLKFAWVEPEKGLERELDWYKKHSESLTISIIKDFDDYVKTRILSMGAREVGEGFKKKYTKKKKRKKRKKRKKNTKKINKKNQKKKSYRKKSRNL